MPDASGSSTTLTRAVDVFLQYLLAEGASVVFGVPGGLLHPFFEAVEAHPSLSLIVTKHEEGAAFMADVYGRLSTYPGVCMATLGPGATNLITGIGDAALDRAPLVAITGQAGLERVYKESHQYIDVVQMLRPITKWNARVERPAAVPEMVRKAFRLSRLEKPGATHLELPEDVAAMSVPPGVEPLPVRRTTYPQAGPVVLERAAVLLCQAKRPLVLVGNGVIRRQASGHRAADALGDLVHRLNLPVIHTFMGKGCIDYRDPHALGAVGLQRRGADLAAVPQLAEADLVVTVGYDLVEWAPALWNPRRAKEILHIDSTPAEIDGHYLPALEVVGEIGHALRALAGLCEAQEHTWWEAAKGQEEKDSEETTLSGLQGYSTDDSWPMKPQRVIWDLRQALADDDILVSDVGAHKLWLALLYPASKPNTVIISNGFATMGIAVPGGVAAKLALPDRKVVAVSGDGGFLMNSQELETARRLRVPYVNVVWTDRRYGIIELNQQRRFGRTFGVEFTNPDLVQYAASFGIPGWRVLQPDGFAPLLRRALEMDTPTLIEVPVDHTENTKLGVAAGG